LLFTILVEGGMLSSLPWFLEPLGPGRLHTGSWTVESSHQHIDGDWYIVTRFCNILRVCNLIISKSESSEIRVARKNLQTLPGKQDSSRCGKMRSMGSAGAAAGSPDIFGPSMSASFTR
jgi:hypothetical protein